MWYFLQTETNTVEMGLVNRNRILNQNIEPYPCINQGIQASELSCTTFIFKRTTVKSRWIDTLWQGSCKFWPECREKVVQRASVWRLDFPLVTEAHTSAHTHSVLHAERFSDSRAKLFQFTEIKQCCQICTPAGFPRLTSTLFFSVVRQGLDIFPSIIPHGGSLIWRRFVIITQQLNYSQLKSNEFGILKSS